MVLNVVSWSLGNGGGGGCVCVLPVDYEVLIGRLLVTDGTHPSGLLLVHLQVQRCVEALQVGAGERPARDGQTHLAQLRRNARAHVWKETCMNMGRPLGKMVRTVLYVACTQAHVMVKIHLNK